MISFVIPVYNENESICELHDKIIQVMESLDREYEILFIDDGSTDGSRDTIQQRQKKYKNVRPVFFRTNTGKSSALNAGFQIAEGEIIFTMDADLQDDPEEIPRFLTKIDEGYDLVTGWKVNRKDSLEKKLPSKLFNIVTSKMSGLDLKDYNCGFKCYKREVILEVYLYGELHRFIPFLAHKKGFRVGEIPVNHYKRKHGRSKFGRERYARGFLDLLTVVFITNYFARPIHFLGGVSAVFFLAGMSIFCYLFFGRWIFGEGIGTSPLFSISIFLMGSGIQIFTVGLISALIVDNHERDKMKRIYKRH